MRAMLAVRTGKVAGTDFPIAEEARIGRAATNEVRLPISEVSNHHARIWSEEGLYFVMDTGSTNGTFVNGERIHKIRLRHLDVLSLGKGVDLIFLQREERPATRRKRPTIQEVTLRWLSGEDEGESFPIAPGRTTVGRAPSCTLVAMCKTISKLHAEISRYKDRVIIQDVGSTNGTRVNNQPITERTELQDNDRVIFGQVESRIRIVGETAEVSRAEPGDTDYRSMVFDQAWRTRLIWNNEEMEEAKEMPAARPSLDDLSPSAEETTGKKPGKHD